MGILSLSSRSGKTLYRPGYGGARYHLFAEKLRLLFLNTYTYEGLEKGW